MFKSKIEDRLAELERAVTAATQAVVSATAATRDAWQRVKDTRNALEDSPGSPALAVGLREAEWAHRIARDKDEAAHDALKAAEVALVVAKEQPARAELAKTLQSRRRRLTVLKNELVPLLKAFEAEIVETHHNALLWSLTGGSKQIHESLPGHLDFLIEHLEVPGGLDLFLQHLDIHAAGILDGSKPASWGQTS